MSVLDIKYSIKKVLRTEQRFPNLLSKEDYDKLQFLKANNRKINYNTRKLGKDEFRITEVNAGNHQRLIISKVDRSQEPINTTIYTKTKDFLSGKLIKIHPIEKRYIQPTITGMNLNRLNCFDFILDLIKK